MDTVRMRFPNRGVTYMALDGTRYPTDTQGFADVRVEHVDQAVAAGARPAETPAPAAVLEDAPVPDPAPAAKARAAAGKR